MGKDKKTDLETFKVTNGKDFSLKNFVTDIKKKGLDKEEGKKLMQKSIDEMAILQDVLFADNRHAVLIVIQAMDAAGKDGTIKHIMSGVNPAGVTVTSFKSPSVEELDHDYFWRHYKALPAKGEIGIFNRSHYENVLVTKVHPEYILGEKHSNIHSVDDVNKDFWEERYKQICRFEDNLTGNDTTILKFFLHVSKDEQKKRFLDRIDDPEKNWKFSTGDLTERALWDDYQKAYEDAIKSTSSKTAPWYIIPADDKWYMRYVVGEIICNELKSLNLKYPEISEKDKAILLTAKQELLNEDSKK